MTYWFLLAIAVCCVVAAGVLFWCTDAFTTGSDLVDLSALIVSLICVLAALGTGIGFIVANLDRTSCYQQGRQTGMHVHYELLSGCYVQVDDHLIPYDRWVQVSGVNTP